MDLFNEYERQKQQRELDSGKVDVKEVEFIRILLSRKNILVVSKSHDFLRQVPYSRADN